MTGACRACSSIVVRKRGQTIGWFKLSRWSCPGFPSMTLPLGKNFGLRVVELRKRDCKIVVNVKF